jgi:osmoprotectant transport system ATP-binding protein
MNGQAIAIAVKGATKSYDSGRTFAVRDISLDVGAGEFVALVGTSGSGKTTLLKLINRLIEASAGAIEVEGTNVAEIDPVLLRRRIGYVFQGVGLFPHLSVAENIAITPRLLGWDSAHCVRRVEELLDLVRLPRDLGERFPSSLSGGQAQRVGVARALAAEPKIVLMDEPFGAVDQITRGALAGDYRELHDRLGLTTVMVTHDVTEAVLLADRIAIVVDGEIVEIGTARDLLARTQNDYARELMSLPRLQAERIRALSGKEEG